MKKLLVILTLLVSTYVVGQPTYIFKWDFETAPTFTNNPTNSFTNWDETCCAWSFTTSDSAKRAGIFAGRFELRKSDPSPQPNDSKRTQMEWNGFAVPMGATWYAMSIQHPSWMGFDPAPEDLFDLHDRLASGAGSNWTNPFGIWEENGRWNCHITYDSIDVTTDNGANIKNKKIDLGAVVPGQWVDWILHTNYSFNDTGYVQIYKNGVLVVDYHGKCAYRGAQPDPYFKFGIYKWPWAVSNFSPASTQTLRVFYFDNLRIGGRTNTLSDFLIGSPNTNLYPIARAGNDYNITLPTSSIGLVSSSTDPDGTIAAVQWTKLSGPSCTLTTPTSSTCPVTGMSAGTYVFQLDVTDNGGLHAFDTVQAVVNPSAPPNTPPTVDAGANQTLTIAFGNTTINTSVTATASDPGGSISSYSWTKVSGPSTGTIASPTSATTSLTGLTGGGGNYVFQVTVTDNGGLTATDIVTITVNPPINTAPIANAGTDQAITLPTSTATLNGSSSRDAEGPIASYSWVQLTGPGTATISSTTTVTTNISGLIQGTYTFKLTVTDGSAATAVDTVAVVVNPALAPPTSIIVVSKNDFETASSATRGIFDARDSCCSYSMAQSDSFYRTGTKSLRIENRSTDPTIKGSKVALLYYNSIVPDTSIHWWGLSTYFPVYWQSDPTYELIMMWHSKFSGCADGTALNLGIQVLGNNLYAQITYDTVSYCADNGVNSKVIQYDLGPWVKGKWVDWAVQANFSNGSDGYIKIWMNGVLKVNYVGKCAYAGSFAPYFVVGDHKWPWLAANQGGSTITRRAFFVDNVKMGNKNARLGDFNPRRKPR